MGYLPRKAAGQVQNQLKGEKCEAGNKAEESGVFQQFPKMKGQQVTEGAGLGSIL